MNLTYYKQKIGSILKDNASGRIAMGKQSGDLCNKRLSRYFYTSKVFQDRSKEGKKNYEVFFLVDCSGSMNKDFGVTLGGHASYEKIDVCIEAVTQACSILDGHAKMHILGYNVLTKDHTPKGMLVQNIKNVERSLKSQASDERSYGNIDHVAVRTVVDMVKKADKSSSKVVIVMSDGFPWCDYAGKSLSSGCYECKEHGQHECGKQSVLRDNLKKEVYKAVSAGIEIYALGIGDRAVEDFYPKDRVQVLNKPEDMYTALTNILQRVVKKRQQ